MTHPTYSQRRKTGNKGVNIVKGIVDDELDWIFRPVHLEDDFGLDGHIDIIGDDNSVSGKSIGVQVKTGKSYFSSPTSFGWKYRGEEKHLGYYLNYVSPIIIVIVNESNRQAYWVEFELEQIEQTSNGWSITVPKANLLNVNSKSKLAIIAGEVIDYMDQLQYQWDMNKSMKESKLVFLQVDKNEVINNDVSGFTKLLKRLTINDEMILRTRGKISFYIDGYNDDPRELYEIDEVREWIKTVLPAFKYWGYFLCMETSLRKLVGLRILQTCTVDVEIVSHDIITETKYVSFDIKQSFLLLEQLYGWLNEFSDAYSIPESINEEQSRLMFRTMFPGETDTD